MQCPNTPQIDSRNAYPTPESTAVATSAIKRRKVARNPLSTRTNIKPPCMPEFCTPSKKNLRYPPIQRRGSPTWRFSQTPSTPTLMAQTTSPDNVFDDAFCSPKPRKSNAALQFHDAARRLRLSRDVQQPAHPEAVDTEAADLWIRATAAFGSPEKKAFRGEDIVPPARQFRRHNLQERDITSAKRGHVPTQQSCDGGALVEKRQSTPSLVLSPKPRFESSFLSGQTPRTPVPSKPWNFSRPSRVGADGRHKLHPHTRCGSISAIPLPSNMAKDTQTVTAHGMEQRHFDRTSHLQSAVPLQLREGEHSKVLPTSNTDTPVPVPILTEALPPDMEHQTRASFDSAVSECLGDRRLKFKRWQVWLIRVLFSLFVFGVNIALGLAYLGSHKHPYLLAVLVFMKSKDILSTIVDVIGMLRRYCHDLIWPPKKPTPKWILSLVCAYAETEEQIMKTVLSLAQGKLGLHQQAICIILDGKPRDVLAKMSEVKPAMRLPYTTWTGNRGDLVIHAGLIAQVPTILIEKVKNAGKKDSLVLGHDLFNWQRDDVPRSTRLLREELWKKLIPQVILDTELKAFDFIFCTDADSTIHETALQKLADALCRETNAIAGCGVLFAEFGPASTEYSMWHLFQQFQYTFGQYVRRQAESTWGRVTCLPGCITMIAVRPEMGPALSAYAMPVQDHNLFRHQVQYLGTDRRLTWCMMSQNKHMRTVFVPEALSETVTPSSVSHYLSQRRRWASNAYFNDLFYLFGPQQRLVTRVFAAIDLVRLTLVFYRVFNTAYFLHGLITNFYVIKIIPTLIVTKTPATWYLLLISLKEPHLRKRLHKILLGMLINQVISPFLSVIVFFNVLLNMGNATWGKTGASTKGTGAMVVPPLAHESKPAQQWTPRRLAKSIRAAIRGRTPTVRSKVEPAVDIHADMTQPAPRRGSPEPLTALVGIQGMPSNPAGIALTSSFKSLSEPAAIIETPAMRFATRGQDTPSTFHQRRHHTQKRANIVLEPVQATPTRASASSQSSLTWNDADENERNSVLMRHE